ncbi:MAG: thioredoxin domain-containing protein [Acidobacteria bacterium]|nr:thioredoxin domain-containing protein [Acidobacteriota bacterium]
MLRFGTLFLASLLSAQDWKTAAELPGVSFTGLPAAGKGEVLQVLRTTACPCGCPMQIAQCRVEDPGCGTSRALANDAVDAAKAGQDIAKTLAASPQMKAAANRNRILLDPVEIRLDGAPARGPQSARITLVEFSDFQCPYCIRATSHLEAVLKAFPKDVRLVYKHFPLDSHGQARLAAQASLAAHQQGKFWPMHDRLYQQARQINRMNILNWAKELGLDMPKFVAALDSPPVKAQVEGDVAEGNRIGVQGTPSVFVNGKKYQGPLDPETFLPVLTKELAGR